MTTHNDGEGLEHATLHFGDKHSNTAIAREALHELRAAVAEHAHAAGVALPAAGWKTDKLGSSLAWPADTSTDGVGGNDGKGDAPHG